MAEWTLSDVLHQLLNSANVLVNRVRTPPYPVT